MKFSEYLDARGHNVLTLVEHDILGIPKTKGYVKRYRDKEITEEQLQRLSEAVQKKTKLRSSVIGRIMEITKPYEKDKEKQYLYFLVNEIGRTKIGISYDPIKRARNITTASGMMVKCLKAWDIADFDVREVEQRILKRYINHKTFGEWFVEGSVDLERIEDWLRGNEITCSEIHADLETKKEYEFYDQLDFVQIRHQTEKAYLFECEDDCVWIPKKHVMRLDKSSGTAKITKGKLESCGRIPK